VVIRATLGRDDGVIAIMDAGVTAILGALIGASSGILSGLGVEALGVTAMRARPLWQ